MFKKFRGIRLPYKKQGLIYFTCVNLQDMPCDVKEKIMNLCTEVGGQNYKALYEVVTNDNKSILQISKEYFINEKKLYRMRKEFYERFDETKIQALI